MHLVKTPLVSQGRNGIPKPSSLWTFDEGAGVLVCDKTGRSNASLVNGPAWGVVKHLGKSFTPDGVSQHALVSNSAATAPYSRYDFAQTGITFTAWVTVKGAINNDTNQFILSGAESGNLSAAAGGLCFRSGSAYNGFYATIYSGGYITTSDPPNLGVQNGDVVFAAVVFSRSGLVTVYVNGKPCSQMSYSPTAIEIDPAYFSIGAFSNGGNGQFYKGAIGPCAIHKASLTARQIESIYLRGYETQRTNQLWVPGVVGAGGTDHLVTPANSQQINTAGGASVWQTHQVGASSSTQANVGTAGSVSQGSITQVTAANSTQPNTASAGSIAQTHQVGAASSGTGHTGTAAAVSQTHLISAASSQQANTATAGSVSQSGAQTVSAADSVQANTASAGGISQTHMIVCAPVAVDNVASASSIVQTHLIGAANSVQGNSATAGGVTSSAPGAAVWPLASQVLAGVVYGPTGVEYTGTFAGTTGPSAADIAAAVRADLAAELAMLDSAVSSRATVTQIMEYAGP